MICISLQIIFIICNPAAVGFLLKFVQLRHLAGVNMVIGVFM